MRVSAVALALALVCLSAPPPAFAQVGGSVVGIPAGQAPARDTQKPRVGTSRIAGRVVSAETGAPVRRAVVRLSSRDGVNIGQNVVMTDGDGNFEFKSLPAGAYALFASKSGYLSSQQVPGSDPLGRIIKLGEDEAATSTVVALARAGAIGGRVLDEFGEPLPNVYVQVWRRQSVQGVKRMVGAGSSNGGTNDLGQYRVFGLQPGTYYVSATARPEGGSDVESADRTGYAPTYFPGTTSPTEAQPIEIAAGQDASGIDFMLSVARMGRISGIVIGSSGQRLPNTSVSAMLSTPGGMTMPGGGSGAQVQQDGTFVLHNLAPGDYLIVARSYAGGRGGGPAEPELGQARVHVAGDVTGVVIQMSQGSTLSGQVIYDSTTPRTSGAQRVSISTSAADPFDSSLASMSGGSVQVQADGTFVVRNLFGDRIVRVSAPSGWMLKGIYANGRDVTDSPIAFDGREAVGGVQVVLTDRVTHVSGAVTDELGRTADSAWVMVVPADAGRPLFSGRYLRTAVARGGNPWKIDALPPADYVAIALRSNEGLDTQDSDFLEQVRKVGTRFTVREGETKDVPLKLSTVPKG